MASEVDIANVALSMIGANTITSLTEGSNNANKVNQIYEPYRDHLLRRYIWKFATKRIKLARSANAPVFEYDYQFPVPSDFIRIIEVHDNEDGIGTTEYRLEYDDTDTRVISASAEELWLKYVAEVTDPNAMGPDFRMVLSLKLAGTLAISIAESGTLRDRIMEEYKDTIRGARAVAGQEDFPEDFPEGTWTGVRDVDPRGGWA